MKLLNIFATTVVLIFLTSFVNAQSKSTKYIDDLYGGSSQKKAKTTKVAEPQYEQQQVTQSSSQYQHMAEETPSVDMDEYSPGMFESMLAVEDSDTEYVAETKTKSNSKSNTDDNVNLTINFGWTPSWYAGGWGGWGFYSPSWITYNSWYSPWYCDPWFYPTYFPPYFPAYYRPYYNPGYWGHNHWHGYDYYGPRYYGNSWNSNRHHSDSRAYRGDYKYSSNRRGGTMMGNSSNVISSGARRTPTASTSGSKYFSNSGNTISKGDGTVTTTRPSRAGGDSDQRVTRSGSVSSSSSTTRPSSSYTPNSNRVRTPGSSSSSPTTRSSSSSYSGSSSYNRGSVGTSSSSSSYSRGGSGMSGSGGGGGGGVRRR